LDLKAQKAYADTQLGQLKSRNENLTADLAELKRVQERVAELEGVAAGREQMLSQSEQKLAELAEELSREKTNKEMLNSELLMKADRVAELEQKLEATLSSRSEMENNIEKTIKEIEELQEQLLDAKAQKGSAEKQLEQLSSSYEELRADLNELKGAKERAAALEGELAARDQALSRSEQQLSHLAKELDQEKESRRLLSSELSIKADLVAEFQQRLQTSQANQHELEKTIEKSKKEIAALQNQQKGLKAQQIPSESSAVIFDVKPKTTSKSEASGEQDESPSPSDIIDWVLKKKAK
jgi:chromosome segregation protein